KDILDTKIFDKITQVGGNGNEDVFKSIQDIQEETKYTVETISELDTAIKKSDANDIIRFKNDDKITGSIDISTKKAITIEFN
ncbi:cell surface protein, partial [Clostridioides difficile]|nr:cell surface protein [Clostridioides difficile]